MNKQIVATTETITIGGSSIRKDNYGRFCLNDLHKASGGEKRHQPSNWLDLQQTIELIEELAAPVIPGAKQNQPVSVINGVGTYVCKELVYAYAMWISPKFSIEVIRTFDAVVTQPQYKGIPTHVKRYLANVERIPITHFSMLNEVYMLLHRPLEDVGYIVPDGMWIDISTGLMFCKWQQDRGIDTKTLPTYWHVFSPPDERKPVEAKLYPIEWLGDFRAYFMEEWMAKHAVKYFGEQKRCESLPYLEKMKLPALGINKPMKAIAFRQPTLSLF